MILIIDNHHRPIRHYQNHPIIIIFIIPSGIIIIISGIIRDFYISIHSQALSVLLHHFCCHIYFEFLYFRIFILHFLDFCNFTFLYCDFYISIYSQALSVILHQFRCHAFLAVHPLHRKVCFGFLHFKIVVFFHLGFLIYF